MGQRRTQENPNQYGGMLEVSEARGGMAHLKEFKISSVERKQKRLVRGESGETDKGQIMQCPAHHSANSESYSKSLVTNWI